VTADAGTLRTERPAALFVRNLDAALVLLAVPVALALGAPALGVAVGAGAWLVQRLIAERDKLLIARAKEPMTRLSLNFAEAFGRIWLLAGAIVAADLIGGRRDGLAAALLICAAYSVAFAMRLARGRPGGPQR
jgi:hypothetical protein